MTISLTTVNQIFAVIQAVIQEVQIVESQWNKDAATAPVASAPTSSTDANADSQSTDTQDAQPSADSQSTDTQDAQPVAA